MRDIVFFFMRMFVCWTSENSMNTKQLTNFKWFVKVKRDIYLYMFNSSGLVTLCAFSSLSFQASILKKIRNCFGSIPEVIFFCSTPFKTFSWVAVYKWTNPTCVPLCQPTFENGMSSVYKFGNRKEFSHDKKKLGKKTKFKV